MGSEEELIEKKTRGEGGGKGGRRGKRIDSLFTRHGVYQDVVEATISKVKLQASEGQIEKGV